MKKNWAIFISGTGSNLGALLDLKGAQNIRLVVSSNAKAFGLLKAKRSGVPALVLSKPIDWSGVLKTLEQFNINAIFLAGFMKIVPTDFISRFKGPIFNVHPSLLPAYPGLNSIEKAFQDKKPLGVTIHHVAEMVDSGDVVVQRKSEAYDDLNISEFLVHLSEHRLVREVMSKC